MNELPIVNGSIDEKRLLECIHCGLCLPACPTHLLTGEEMPSPRGRLYLMRAVHENRLKADDARFHEHEWSCLVCRACETVCPSGVDFAYLMEQTRETLVQTEPPKRLRNYLYRNVLESRTKLNVLQSALAILDTLHLVPFIRSIGKALAPIFPRLSAALRLTPSGVRLPKARPSKHEASGAPKANVGLLTGCIGDAFTASINDATIRVLTGLGYSVQIVPNVTCCGSLQIHGGYRTEALELGRSLIENVLTSNADWYVSNIAGCGAMLKDYKHLFAESEMSYKANLFHERTRDISEFLAEHAIESLRGIRNSRKISVAYHAACHLYHAQQITDLPMQLLSAIPNLEIITLPGNELCCGSAGSYNIEHPHESDALLARKLMAIEATPADVIVTANAGCLLQLQKGLREQGSHVRVVHLIQLIDELMHQ